MYTGVTLSLEPQWNQSGSQCSIYGTWASLQNGAGCSFKASLL